jgi:hypothetical protein
MSSIAAFPFERTLGSLRLRLRECYGLVALLWLIAVYHRLAAHDDLTFPFAAIIWLVLLPVADAVSVRLRRIARGRSLFGMDYRHLHHYLLATGWTRVTTLLLLTAVAALLAAASYYSWYIELSAEVLPAALLALIAFHAWMSAVWRRLTGFSVLMSA